MNYLIKNLIQKLEDGLSQKDVKHFYIGMPDSEILSESVLNNGAIIIRPIGTGIRSITTGIQEEDSYSLAIILAKNHRGNPSNSQKEPADVYQMRLMEGRNEETGELLANTIRYIVRSNLRTLGLFQSEVSIEYDTEEIKLEGAASATMTITQVDHTNQFIN